MSVFDASQLMFNNPSFYNGVIKQSLRYNYGDSPHLTRTADSGNRRTFTFSCWIKRTSFNQTNSVFGAVLNGTNFFMIRFRDTDDPDGGKLQIGNYSGSFDMDLRTSQVFRDPAAWYHIVVAVDTTQAAASDRVKLYVNGSQVTSFSTATYPSQNFETRVSNGHSEQVGAEATSYSYIDGYLAEVNFIDGTQLTPSSFGETKNGVWIPKAISGLTYGTNGFRLTFADSSSLGDDTSGNGNDFTSSGLASTDIVLDSPENNFCTINSVRESLVYNGSVTFSEGNLQSVDAGTTYSLHWTGTFGMSTGKWYWEVLAHTMGGSHSNIGICNEAHKVAAYGTGLFYGGDGKRQNVAFFSGITNYGASYTNGDIIGVAFDADNETVTFYKNNSSQGAVGSVLTTANGPYFAAAGDAQNATTYKYVVNFGQDSSFAGNKTAQGNTDDNDVGDFYYSPPSGYLALCSANLPEPTLSPNQLEQANDHFNTVLYTGDGNTTQNITGVGFMPDWTWLKERSSSSGHVLADSSRGYEKFLTSHTYNVESTGILNNNATRTNDGFQTTNSGASNQSSQTYVAWNWKANGGTKTTVSIGDISSGVPSIASEVQANTKAGFSIVLYTGTGASSGTIAHGLGAVPKQIWVKNRDASYNWKVYHAKNTSAPETDYLVLDNTDATVDSATHWNDTAPDANVFTIGSSNGLIKNTNKYLAYCFAEIEGYSKFGSYVGNGSTNGTFVFTGFRPAFLLYKISSATGNWIMDDNKTQTFNPDSNYLVANSADAEGDTTTNTAGHVFDMLANGFKMRNTNSDRNANGANYIYMAFAEVPFKFANAR